MFGKSLRALLASVLIVGLARPASAQTHEFGPEETLYVYCKWMKSDLERAITPLEQITWRDTVNVYDDGRRFISQHIGSYITSLEDEFEKRVGRGGDCSANDSPNYDYPSDEPGVTSQVVDGRMVTMVLEKVDPAWFLIDRFSDNLKVAALSKTKKVSLPRPQQEAAEKTGANPAVKGPSAAETAAQERATRAAEREAEFQRKQAAYEAELAEQKRKVAEFEQAQADIAKRKVEQAAAAQAAQDAYRIEKEAHDAKVAQYERDVAAQKILADFDKRNGLGEASTDTDANRCITTAETRLDDTFKGNTSASIINGCGEPVDVRICLMTDKGWNCGVRSGVASQATASFSSFGATGQIFVDATISGSGKSPASPR